MYALIYDDHDLARPLKRVISLHRSRKTAEKALFKRMKRLGKRVWECHTRIVWVDGKVKTNDYLNSSMFSTWRSGEKIPWGELHSDSD
ncbi:MAG: hypothetical protein AMJ54_16945 [Deltaproteobacteria bacterium SG8_13]|nr:MAG: hypothetical protein AMJ54_16945 [Deltaproteobacteria bacterium SG8_13]